MIGSAGLIGAGQIEGPIYVQWQTIDVSVSAVLLTVMAMMYMTTSLACIRSVRIIVQSAAACVK